ncbi:MAG: glycosyltransferase family 39 protein [Planctomycetes bacterium]|nr:glycosyltransferase family 39 protein [Planctomycetota bacterium]
MGPAPGELGGTRRWTALSVAVGCALRLARPDVHSLWIDEGMTVRIAEATDPYAFFAADSHPPLSFLLFRAWIALCGTSDLALRLLPALAACVSLVLFVRLAGAWLGRERAAWATALYAASPLLVWHAHEVRMYAFVELAALLVLLCARRVWERPGLLGFAGLALAVAVATGLHYYGALAGLAVLVQAMLVPGRPWRRTGLAAVAGVATWTPWLWAWLPAQTGGLWPVVVKDGARDLLELPARLLACDLALLDERGVELVGWAIGALALLGFVLGTARVLRARRGAQREAGALDAALSAWAPIVAAWVLAQVAGGGFQPRYLVTAVPGLVACVALGLLALWPRWVGRAATALLAVSLCATSVLQLGENRREDYRAAAAEIATRWREGDRLLLLVCVPSIHQPAALEHYLRDRPEILAARLDTGRYLDGIDRPPAGTRLHVVWREASLCWEPMHRLEATHAIVERAPARFRIHRLIAIVP